MARLQFFLLVILLCVIKFLVSKNYDVIPEKIVCTTPPNSICRNVSCNVRPINRSLTYADVTCDSIATIDNAVVRVILYYKFAEYRKFLVDIEENMCAYLRNRNTTNVLKVLMPIILTATEIDSCPVAKGHLVLVKNLNVNINYSIPFLPAGRYRVDAFFTNNKRPIFTSKFYLAFKSTGIAKLDMG